MRIVIFIFFYFLCHFSLNAKNIKRTSISKNNTEQTSFSCDNYFEVFYFDIINEDNIDSNKKLNIKISHHFFTYSILKTYKTFSYNKFYYDKGYPKYKLFKICVLRI